MFKRHLFKRACPIIHTRKMIKIIDVLVTWMCQLQEIKNCSLRLEKASISFEPSFNGSLRDPIRRDLRAL